MGFPCCLVSAEIQSLMLLSSETHLLGTWRICRFEQDLMCVCPLFITVKKENTTGTFLSNMIPTFPAAAAAAQAKIRSRGKECSKEKRESWKKKLKLESCCRAALPVPPRQIISLSVLFLYKWSLFFNFFNGLFKILESLLTALSRHCRRLSRSLEKISEKGEEKSVRKMKKYDFEQGQAALPKSFQAGGEKGTWMLNVACNPGEIGQKKAISIFTNIDMTF